jgi:hypothetical protein
MPTYPFISDDMHPHENNACSSDDGRLTKERVKLLSAFQPGSSFSLLSPHPIGFFLSSSHSADQCFMWLYLGLSRSQEVVECEKGGASHMHAWDEIHENECSRGTSAFGLTFIKNGRAPCQ